MEYGAGLGEIERWNYSALGQDPASDAPDARLQVSVFTEYSDAETWIIIGVIAAVAVVSVTVVIVAVVLVRRRRRNRPAGAGTVADPEPAPGE